MIKATQKKQRETKSHRENTTLRGGGWSLRLKKRDDRKKERKTLKK